MERHRFYERLTTRWVGRDFEYFPVLDSTNARLRSRLVAENVPDGAMVVAARQTAGRGRLGRSWLSPTGGLYVSYLFYPERERLDGVIGLLAGVALSDAVRAVTGVTPGLKWPNDGVIGGRKYAGILVEAGTEPRPWAIVGIGVNVGQAPPGGPAHGVGLAEAAGREVSWEDVGALLTQNLERDYEKWLVHGNRPVVQRWEAYNVTLGQVVEVRQGERVVAAGRADRIDDDGFLWVSPTAGPPIRVSGGEVSIRLAGDQYAPGPRD